MSTCTDMTQRAPRTRVSELHAHLVCVLCGGYYVDATTIVECLHTFCRSCIVRYLESSKFCPMCDVQVHKTKPLMNLRPDKTLQDLVYKVVPSSYSAEMQRRREYYNILKQKAGVDAQGIPPEDKGEPVIPEFFSPEDSVSLSLEYYTGEEKDEKDNEGESAPKDKDETAETKQDQEVKKERQNIHKRYLQCPAAVGIRHLKKFIRLKYDLSQDYKVDIIYEGEVLREEYTLMDVAYTFSWKKIGQMRFYYRIYERPRIVHPISETASDRTISDNNDEPPMKRPRVLSSDSAGTNAGTTSTASSTSVNTSDQKSSQPPADPAEPIPPPPIPAAADMAEPVVAKHRVEKEGKRSRSKSTDNKKAEPAPPPSRPKTPTSRPKTPTSRPKTPTSRPKTPKIPKEKKESSTPRIVLAAESKRDSSTQSTPKIISPPPKPIMPGQKPPSQTALLLQQRIIQQRQQQQQKMQLQKQQQQKLMMQKQQQMNNMHQKQIPSLNKLQPSQKQSQQMKLNRLNSSPSTVNKSPAVSSSSQTTSKPVSVQTSSSSKQQTPPVSKPAPITSSASKSVPTTPVSKPNVSQATNKPAQATNKPVQTAVSNGKPVTSTQTTPKQAPVGETRKGENSFIEKEKRSPVVVIERQNKKNASQGEKSAPIVHKDKSPPPATPKVPKSMPETTLSVAPGGSATKLRLVKRPATSPAASSPPVAKKVASEIPKPNPPAILQPLEIKTGEKPRHDDFGALDLSGKSSRKSDSPSSSHSSGAASPPAPSPPEPRTSPAPKVPPPQPPPPPPRPQNSSKSSKNQSPQTIMSIAQTLVNRQLSNLGFNSEGSRSPNSPHSQGSSSPSSQGSSGGGSGLSFRNLMTLTDTAVQLRNNMQTTPSLPALQRTPTPQPRMRLPTPQQSMKPTYGRASNASGNMRSPPPPSAAIRIPSVPNMNKTSPPRTTENGPMMSPTRVARLHDIFPGPQSKPGPNQSVRHIPNPSLLFRQQANRMQQPQQQSCKDEITITPARNPTNPSLSSIRKIENLTRNIGEGKAATAGMGVRVATEATQ